MSLFYINDLHVSMDHLLLSLNDHQIANSCILSEKNQQFLGKYRFMNVSSSNNTKVVT